ncbi:MAG: CRISPR-associated protein, Csx3 family [Candidatus Kapaibacterium sp.]|nr:MAG: CRISPR-associated protein, Csx3 family [Candidatus Kapabacteria bacterium]
MQNLKLSLIQTPENFQILDILLENNGIISPLELNTVEIPSEIDWSKGVVIAGRAPIWLYTYLVHQCHPSAWVAIYDPRWGAIVIQTHKIGAPSVGEIIQPSAILKYYKLPDLNKKIIAFLGNPHTGKSVFLKVLRNTLRKTLPDEVFHRGLFVIKACPDGEGDWFGELPEDQGKIYRYKNRFDDDFIRKVVSNIELMKNEKSILLIDCGGKIDKYNQEILNKCTHSIILGTDDLSIAEWRGASKLAGVDILAEVISSKKDVSKVLNTQPLLVEYGFLDRNKKDFLPIPDELIDKIINK